MAPAHLSTEVSHDKLQSLQDTFKHFVKGILFLPPKRVSTRRSYMKRPRTIYGVPRITIGKTCSILAGAYLNAVEAYSGVTYDPKITIGDDIYTGRACYLTALDEITIGTGCMLGEHVYITDLTHDLIQRVAPLCFSSSNRRGLW